MYFSGRGFKSHSGGEYHIYMVYRKCNCRSKPKRPLNGECLTQCLVYKATSTTSTNSFVYYGTSEGEFKSRYNNHAKCFRHRECMNETEENPQKGLAITMWLKTLRSMFVRKTFHYLC